MLVAVENSSTGEALCHIQAAEVAVLEEERNENAEKATSSMTLTLQTKEKRSNWQCLL